MVQEALLSESTDGWDASANNGKGGVKVNWWLDGHTPSQNTGHDAGEDLRDLQVLTLYKGMFPADTSLDAAIAKMEPIDVSLFQANGYDKSWSWPSFTDLGWWSAAQHICKFWMSQIDAKVGVAHGSLVESTAAGAATIPDGYRVDAAAQKACGLIAIGNHFNDAAMVAAGEKMLQVVISQAFVTKYGMFARIVATPASSPKIIDFQAKMGEQGQTAWTLALAGKLDAAKALLDGMKASAAHDTVHGGFFFKQMLDSGQVSTNYKEQGRCMTIARVAKILGDTGLRDEMFDTARKSFQKAKTAGWAYEVNPDFTLYGKPPQAWITSESINLNVLAILTAA